MIIWNENKKVKKKIIVHIDKRAGLFPYKKDPAHGRVQSSIINKNYNSKMDGIWAGEGGGPQVRTGVVLCSPEGAEAAFQTAAWSVLWKSG